MLKVKKFSPINGRCITINCLIQHESAPRVIDNIIGAIARAVIGDLASAPVDEIVNAITSNLPLKEDKEEYDVIFKFFTTLLASQHPSFHKCLPKIVECSAIFYTDLTIDKVLINHLEVSEIILTFSGKVIRLGLRLVETNCCKLWS